MRRWVFLLAVPILLSGCAEVGKRALAGTGDVAFRLLWDGPSDLDLVVQDPLGACISFASRSSPSGGTLDIDCNNGTDQQCERPIENIFWPVAAAPAGEYRLWVNAHSVVPGRTTIPFRVQVLLGKQVFWVREGTVHDTEDVYGPFVYNFPNGKVAGPLKFDPTVPSCGSGILFTPAD
jgi:hypothetical protein